MRRDLPMPASPESSTTWPSPSLCSRPAPQQQFEFFFPPDEGSQPGSVQRLEATFHRTSPQRRPSLTRPGDALEVLGPKVLKLEQVAHEPAGALRNDHRVWFRDALQTRR